MGFNNAKYTELQDKKGMVFRGGIIDNSESNMIPYANTPYARNFRVNGQGISIRPGFSQFGSDLSGTGAPKGIAAYYRYDPANDKIIVRQNVDGTHKLVAVDPTLGTQTSIVTGANIASDNRMNFISANDSLYCMNGSDGYGKLNGTTYTVPTTGVASLAPSFGAWFNNSMFVSGWSTNPNRLYKSVDNNPDDFNSTGSDYYDANYPIVGLATGGQTLYVFTEQTIDMINNNSIRQIGSDLVYTSVPLEATEGASNHNSIVSVGKGVFFLTKSNKIKKVVPNSVMYYDVSEVSHRANAGINNTIATLDPDQTKSFGYHVPDKQLIKWHCKTIGATYNDICIVYNYEYDELMVDTQKTFDGGIWYKSKAFTISQIESKMYLDEYGQSDDDSPIQFEYRTKHIDIGEPTMQKELWEIRTFLALNPLASVTQAIYADGSLIDSRTYTSSDIPVLIDGIGTEEIGTFAIGEDSEFTDKMYNIETERVKGYLQKRCKYFEVRYTCGSLGGKCLLQRLIPKIEVLSPLVTSNIT